MQGDLYKQQQQQQEELHIQQEQEQLQRQEQLLAAPQEMAEDAAHLEASQATMAAQQLQTPVTEEQQASMGKFQRRREKRKAKKEYKERDRLEKEEIARQATLESSVVDGISKEEAEEHGVASFHHTLTEEKARVVVKHANGFLYAKPNGDGTAELKPTLPEKMTLYGKEIEVRKNFNLLNRLLARSVIDENGQLKEGAEEFISEFSFSAFKDLPMSAGTNGPAIEANMREVISRLFNAPEDSLLQADGYDEETAARMCEELADFLSHTRVTIPGGTGYLMGIGEISDAWTSFIRSCTITQTPLQEKLASVTKGMILENGTKELTNDKLEQMTEQKRNAVISLYSDAAKAHAELMKLRNIDINGQDVALVNACSANADFFCFLTRLQRHGSKSLGKCVYETKSYVEAHPLETARWLANQPEGSLTKEEREKAEQIALILTMPNVQGQINSAAAFIGEDRPNETSMERFHKAAYEFLERKSHSARKYEYHQGGIIGTMEKGTVVITLETFAAESSQLTASPITQHIAVGLYKIPKNGPDGMAEYYNHDNPLPDEMSALLSDTNYKMKNGSLPGDNLPS